MDKARAQREAYAKAVFRLQTTVNETSYAFHQMGKVEKGEDLRSPLRRFAQDLIQRHDFRATVAQPILPSERTAKTARAICACMDCKLAAAALECEP